MNRYPNSSLDRARMRDTLRPSGPGWRTFDSNAVEIRSA